MAAPLRVAFLGSDAIALPLLGWLRERRERVMLVGVFTQPDRPVGRGQKVQPNAIKLWAQEQGIPIFQPEKLTPDVQETYAALAPELAVVMAYGHILKEAFIAVPRLGTVNLHASLLPSYRGASPIQTAVAEGEAETGVSLMRIVRRLDAGPVADMQRVCIQELDTALEIETKLAGACVPLLERNWDALAAGQLAFAEQNEAAATFCRKLTKEDAPIDWTLPARRLAARINGLNPWPGANFLLDGQPVKVGLATTGSARDGVPGTIVASGSDGLAVQAGGGTVRLLRLQRPGGKMLAAADFLRGCPLPVGQVLGGATATVLVAREPFRTR
ncbi:methionyl-tRNA formyltransferase [Nibricoccus sp. IMCC34717]|uniref:methionyl-tRNA formyltransferase n=1 Tax=Nibricoccus sp. IMCC34717 TaxID=3034021 RepID=UPI00384CB2A5